MREAKIILKEKIQEFRNLEDLLDSCDNIGITYDGKRFILTHDDAKLWGYAVSANTVILKEDIEDTIEYPGGFRFFIFDSAKELYLWLADGEK